MSLQSLMLSQQLLNNLQFDARTDGKTCVVGALIRNSEGRIFVMKRSADRALFPNCWDIVGGHVEPGETIYAALAREVQEETGWKLTAVTALVKQFDWDEDSADGTIENREFDFLADVDGSFDDPQIETAKFSEFRWVGLDDVEVLKENRPAGDTLIYDVVHAALSGGFDD